MACLYTENGRNTGDPRRWVRDPTGRPRGTGRAVWGVGEVHSTAEPGQRRGREGTLVQGQRKKWRQPGDWREPNTSNEGWEATGDVACQSQECTHVPLLCAVRQGVSSGCAVARLPMLSVQRRQCGCGRPDVRGHRSVRSHEVA